MVGFTVLQENSTVFKTFINASPRYLHIRPKEEDFNVTVTNSDFWSIHIALMQKIIGKEKHANEKEKNVG